MSNVSPASTYQYAFDTDRPKAAHALVATGVPLISPDTSASVNLTTVASAVDIAHAEIPAMSNDAYNPALENLVLMSPVTPLIYAEVNFSVRGQ